VIPDHRLDRLEIMMERLFGIVQILAEINSRHSSLQTSPRFPLRIISEMHELSRDPPAFHIDSQDQFPDPVSSQYVQPIVRSSMLKSMVPISMDEQDQSLEDALAKTRADRLARANIQGDGPQSPMSAALKPASASMDHLNDMFQQFLRYMSLHPHEPGDLS
jgi:hypothetical protein